MTVLQSLDAYYGRMAARGEVEQGRFSQEKISFRIVISQEGEVVSVTSLHVLSGRKLVPKLMTVPAGVKRASGILPNLLWDKTSYTLGRTAGDGWRTLAEHKAFKIANLALIAGSKDAGLVAFRRFLQTWLPNDFDRAPFYPELLDTNVVFALEGDKKDLHERDASRVLLSGLSGSNAPPQMCLVTGQFAAPARLHPTIKGVWGGQSSGASLVSFNLEAFTSYGKKQGDNAPTSEAAAFRYGAALNRLLNAGSGNRLPRPVGDASIVFWAVTSPTVDEAQALAAERAFMVLTDHSGGVGGENMAGSKLELLAKGTPVQEALPGIVSGTRIHVLGLSPNVARTSIRFWLDDTIDAIGYRLGRHYEALNIDPPPWQNTPPSVSRLLVRTTVFQEKFEQISPLLAGEVMRAILSGTPYPRTWLAATIVRLRAGDNPASGWHAAAIKACLHAMKKENTPPVALDPNNPSSAYQLGRLLAVLEAAQYAAFGRVNASIVDRYYGAASTTPARAFGALLRSAQTHVSTATKLRRGFWIGPRLNSIIDQLPAELPRVLRLEDQGRFAIGYYHERASIRARSTKPAEIEPDGSKEALVG